MRNLLIPASFCAALCLVPSHAADDAAEPKELSGISILGNSEAPKSLVIVPWKSSEIGDGIGVSNMLDDRARPVDKDVFMRELDYYELRTGESMQQAARQDSTSEPTALAKQ